MTQRKLSDFQLGTKVHANYGAMYPIVEGMIVDISPNGMITWADEYDGTEYENKWSDFKDKGWKSVNGSGIGVFLGEY